MSTSVALEGRPFPVTQHLIRKYQRYLLGESSDSDGSLSQEKKRDLESSLRNAGIEMKYHPNDKLIPEMSSLGNGDDEREEPSGTGILSQCKVLAYQLFVGDYKKKLLVERITEEKQLAISYDEWCRAGLRLDELTEATKWKQEV